MKSMRVKEMSAICGIAVDRIILTHAVELTSVVSLTGCNEI